MSEEMVHPRFSDHEERALATVLDQIIPPRSDGRLPGAGELGLVRHIEQVVQQAPHLGPVIVQGLSALDKLARSRNPAGFAALSSQDKSELLSQLTASQQGFLPSLIFHTYVGYYQDARVVEALGLEARPPFPKGHEMEPNDLSLLDPVRQRPKLYREG